ncbi:UNVERIFIED_CONTAM: hypothetical protein FKN15_017578 [Acipenser sinensis]
MITSETGKALIQTCLNSPDSPPRSDPSTDQRMSATGFEETDLTYQVSESESIGETKDTLKPAFTVTSLPGTSTCNPTAATTSTTMQVSSGASFPITNYLAPISASSNTNSITSANGTVLKTAATSGGVMQLPSGFTFMSVSLPATIVTSSVPTTMAGHMMYPSPHTLMYASTPALADGSLAVLNAFSQAPSAMQISHGQVQEQGENQGKDEQVLGELKEGGGVPQVFLTGPPGTNTQGADDPRSVSAINPELPFSSLLSSALFQMVIGQQSSNSSHLTELQVVNLDAAHNSKSE